MPRNILEFPYQPEIEPATGLERIFNRSKMMREEEIDKLVQQACQSKNKFLPPEKRNKTDVWRVLIGPLDFTVGNISNSKDGNLEIRVQIDKKTRKKINVNTADYKNEIFLYYISPDLYDKDIEMMVREGLAYYNYLQMLEDIDPAQAEQKMVTDLRNYFVDSNQLQKIRELRSQNQQLGKRATPESFSPLLYSRAYTEKFSVASFPGEGLAEDPLIKNEKTELVLEQIRNWFTGFEQRIMAGNEDLIESIEKIKSFPAHIRDGESAQTQGVLAVKLKGSPNVVFVSAIFNLSANNELEYYLKVMGEAGDYSPILLMPRLNNVFVGFQEEFAKGLYDASYQMVQDFQYLYPILTKTNESSVYSSINAKFWNDVTADGSNKSRGSFYGLYGIAKENIEKIKKYISDPQELRKLVSVPERFFNLEAILLLGPENLRKFFHWCCTEDDFFQWKNQQPHFYVILTNFYQALYRTGKWEAEDYYELTENNELPFPLKDLIGQELNREFELTGGFDNFISLYHNAYQHPGAEQLREACRDSLDAFLSNIYPRIYDRHGTKKIKNFQGKNLYRLLEIFPSEDHDDKFYEYLNTINSFTIRSAQIIDSEDDAASKNISDRLYGLDQTIRLLKLDDPNLTSEQLKNVFHKFLVPFFDYKNREMVDRWLKEIPDWRDPDPESEQNKKYRALQNKILEMLLIFEAVVPRSYHGKSLYDILRAEFRENQKSMSPAMLRLFEKGEKFKSQTFDKYENLNRLFYASSRNFENAEDGWTAEEVASILKTIEEVCVAFEQQLSLVYQTEGIPRAKLLPKFGKVKETIGKMVKELLENLPVFRKNFWANGALELFELTITKLTEILGSLTPYIYNNEIFQIMNERLRYKGEVSNNSVSEVDRLQFEQALRLRAILQPLKDHYYLDDFGNLSDFIYSQCERLIKGGVPLTLDFWRETLRNALIIGKNSMLKDSDYIAPIANVSLFPYVAFFPKRAIEYIFHKIYWPEDAAALDNWYIQEFGAVEELQILQDKWGVNLQNLFHKVYDKMVAEKRMKQQLQDYGGWWEYLQENMANGSLNDELLGKIVASFLEKPFDQKTLSETLARLRTEFSVPIANFLLEKVFYSEKKRLLSPADILLSGMMLKLKEGDQEWIEAYLKSNDFLRDLPQIVPHIKYLYPEMEQTVEESLQRYYSEDNIDVIFDPDKFIFWDQPDFPVEQKYEWSKKCQEPLLNLVQKLMNRLEIDGRWTSAIIKFMETGLFTEPGFLEKIGLPPCETYFEFVQALKRENRQAFLLDRLLIRWKDSAWLLGNAGKELRAAFASEKESDPDLRQKLYESLVDKKEIPFAAWQQVLNYDLSVDFARRYFLRSKEDREPLWRFENNFHLLILAEQNKKKILERSGLSDDTSYFLSKEGNVEEYEPYLQEYINQFFFAEKVYQNISSQRFSETEARDLAERFWQGDFMKIIEKNVRTDVFARLLDAFVAQMRNFGNSDFRKAFVDRSQDLVNQMSEDSSDVADRRLLALCKIETLLLS